ncbi:MAG: hypothetical protein JRE18_01635, partial [Deltaproteobacteria bacterium]|nr:hypothetical protein [Deltaproteobacteria bacterium]
TDDDVPPCANFIERAGQGKPGGQNNRQYDSNTQVETFHHFSSSPLELRFPRRDRPKKFTAGDYSGKLIQLNAMSQYKHTQGISNRKNECPSAIKQLKLIKMAITETGWVWQQKYMPEKSAFSSCIKTGALLIWSRGFMQNSPGNTRIFQKYF